MITFCNDTRYLLEIIVNALTINSDCMVFGGGGTGGFVCPNSSIGFQAFCSSNVGSAQGCNSPEQKIA